MYLILHLLIYLSMFAAPVIGAVKFEVAGLIIGIAYFIIMLLVMGNSPTLYPTAGAVGHIYG